MDKYESSKNFMYNNYKLMFIGTGFSQTENSSPKAHKYCQIYIFGKF